MHPPPDRPQLRALIVGAGAVGTVFGAALERAGAHVSWYVRPRYAEELRSGILLHDLNADREERVTPGRVVTSTAELLDGPFDIAVLCVSSTALRAGWFDDFARELPAVRAWLVLQPGLEDRQYVADRTGDASVLAGLITFIAWNAPLPGEPARPPSVSVWRPPLSHIPIDGDAVVAQRVAAALKAGGLPARPATGLRRKGALPTALMMPALVALELSDWSLRTFATGPKAAEAADAGREATRLVCARADLRLPWYVALIRPFVLRAVARIAPRLVPFDLERYLAYHFTKVGDQTRDFVGTWLAAGASLKVPTPALSALSAELRARDASPDAVRPTPARR